MRLLTGISELIHDIIVDIMPPLIVMLKDSFPSVSEAAVTTVQHMLQYGKYITPKMDHINTLSIASLRSHIKNAFPFVDLIRDGTPPVRSNAAVIFDTLADYGKCKL
jgi:hypothetical protein